MKAASVHLAEDAVAVARCHPVMQQLRTHLDAADFSAQVERQRRQGYRLAFLESDGAVLACAGFRIAEYLAWGRILYVDDLVTVAEARSTGCGAQLFDWLAEHARDAGCVQLHLDSGVQRFAAHRFYLGRGMDITSHHFAFTL
jgi:GNAT superfamily N-acetyltransferase